MKGLYMVRHFDKLSYGNGSKFIGHFFGWAEIIIHDPFPNSFGFRKEIPWAMTLEQPDFKHESSGKILFFFCVSNILMFNLPKFSLFKTYVLFISGNRNLRKGILCWLVIWNIFYFSIYWE